MKPYYGAMNSENQWWDGSTWKNWGLFDSKTGKRSPSVKDALTQFDTVRDHDEFNCHVDGVFKCPRCRRMHFIPDQFDYLCDGCVHILNTHPNTSDQIKAGLALWAKKRQAYGGDPDILARIKERDYLWAVATTEIIAPLSTTEGRQYYEALPEPSAELNGRTKNVGFTTGYIAYRCHWNSEQPEKSGWSVQYYGQIGGTP